LLSVVGRDEPGRSLEKLLKEKGIEASLHHDRGLSTTQKLRVIGRRQQLLRIDFERPPSREVLASKLADFKRALPESDVVILSDYGKGLAHIMEMIRWRRAGSVFCDPKGDDYSRYKGARSRPTLPSCARWSGPEGREGPAPRPGYARSSAQRCSHARRRYTGSKNRDDNQSRGT
jgi:bifunctional ADP-heptose synthase (sugar kinase/adenylyltransferase)